MSKEKQQIEEMAKIIGGNEIFDHEDYLEAKHKAEALYNADYRKQSEGEWVPSDIPQEKYVCSVCGGACWYYDFQGDVAKSRYCPTAERICEEVKMSSTNKYGGITDCEIMDKRVYDLWYQMLRRCYDKEQQKRDKGKSYIGCTVCDEWMSLSQFAKDIKTLDGYENWRDKAGYCLDKDIKVVGNKVYSRETCCFIPYTENIRDMNKRNPHVHSNHKTEYILFNDKEKIYFRTEKDACAFLGVKPCTVSSSYRYGCKCKGYSIAKMKGGAE